VAECRPTGICTNPKVMAPFHKTREDASAMMPASVGGRLECRGSRRQPFPD
jgi:hypothetical protein